MQKGNGNDVKILREVIRVRKYCASQPYWLVPPPILRSTRLTSDPGRSKKPGPEVLLVVSRRPSNRSLSSPQH
jgi:hypothetical protein